MPTPPTTPEAEILRQIFGTVKRELRAIPAIVAPERRDACAQRIERAIQEIEATPGHRYVAGELPDLADAAQQSRAMISPPDVDE